MTFTIVFCHFLPYTVCPSLHAQLPLYSPLVCFLKWPIMFSFLLFFPFILHHFSGLKKTSAGIFCCLVVLVVSCTFLYSRWVPKHHYCSWRTINPVHVLQKSLEMFFFLSNYGYNIRYLPVTNNREPTQIMNLDDTLNFG